MLIFTSVQVERLRTMAEVSLIFFYAPWCAHSMAARQEVEQVAKKLSKQVQFVAVNCWWSQGKCRKLNRLYQYPTIHLFYRRFGPIDYKGPLVAPYVESFILRVITPLIYLPSKATLEEFLSDHESRVVGFFQFNSSPQPPGYITYLSSALQALKWDSHGVVRFGVVTSKQVAEAISVKDDETVYLHRTFNSSLIFPRQERNFTSDGICRWVFEHHESVVQWLQPPGTKSRLLERELNRGPALLLFLPYDPLASEPSALLQQVTDVAVRYHSCGSNASSVSLCCHSVVLAHSRTSVCEVCLSSWSSTGCLFPSAAQGEVLQTYVQHCCLHNLPVPVSAGCSNLLNSYSPFSQYSACCREVEPQLNQSEAKEEPRMQRDRPTPGAPPRAAPLQGGGITGLQCRTNKTLRFYVLDVALNWPLAVRLGASGTIRAAGVRSDAGRVFATIVNLKDEVHYVLQQIPAAGATLTESLEAFIRNFSAPYSVLQRHLVGEENTTEAERSDSHQQPPPPRRRLITELTTSSFLPFVMDLEKDVVLIYYTQWCGFCSALNHIFIQLARLLQGNSTVAVARVNVARNDLPWEFMVDHVPTILLFPRYRKDLSVKFPGDLPVTLPNLLHFILQHSRHTEKPEAACADGPGPSPVLRAEFVALQREVRALHHARSRLSQQLAQLWRDNRRLTFGTRSLEAQNAELQRERQSLEQQHREKSRQLGEAVKRLQELADTSENLLHENMLLKLLLRALKDRAEAGEQGDAERQEAEQKRSHMAS
ncbi:thioredoxin domain-containing protein 11 isoform X2 [Betta splendens]|uniref:Thioredoxin domain-containing protein 11 isoform X2 n=1 Tax=Betta splendens TaxID=158456 RepID=A0A9W2XXT4_BETSP|nr:thioredoxin domain-containing protein 11 isoform X2 [Betta splendens]